MQVDHDRAPDHDVAPLTPPRSRSFLGLTVALAIATAATGVLVETFHGDHRAQANENKADDVARTKMVAFGWRPLAKPLEVRGVELLAAREGFEIPLGHGTVSGHGADPEAVEAAAAVVVAALEHYDPGFLAAAGFRRVVFCADLREDRRPIPSLPNYNRTLLLEVDANSAYLSRLVHHELFHFVDLADDGSVLVDRAWEKLNAPEFQYGLGGRFMRGSEASVQPPPRGFVSGYGTAALEEDKAEIFAEMMWAPDAFTRRAARDPILQKKADHIRLLVGGLSDVPPL